MNPKGPMRKVTYARIFQGPSHPHGSYTRELHLECEHKKYQKASAPCPKKTHCWECRFPAG